MISKAYLHRCIRLFLVLLVDLSLAYYLGSVVCSFRFVTLCIWMGGLNKSECIRVEVVDFAVVEQSRS
jgi:hypothetical protein